LEVIEFLLIVFARKSELPVGWGVVLCNSIENCNFAVWNEPEKI